MTRDKALDLYSLVVIWFITEGAKYPQAVDLLNSRGIRGISLEIFKSDLCRQIHARDWNNIISKRKKKTSALRADSAPSLPMGHDKGHLSNCRPEHGRD